MVAVMIYHTFCPPCHKSHCWPTLYTSVYNLLAVWCMLIQSVVTLVVLLDVDGEEAWSRTVHWWPHPSVNVELFNNLTVVLTSSVATSYVELIVVIHTVRSVLLNKFPGWDLGYKIYMTLCMWSCMQFTMHMYIMMHAPQINIDSNLRMEFYSWIYMQLI